MYSGIFGTGYNFDYIFDVATLLKSEKTIRFVIRGFGERAKELRKKIVKRGLHNIELSTSRVPFDQLMKLLNAADVFFLPMVPLPAHDAGLPTKLFEYMASGKPVICSSTGEASKLVIKSKCGFTVSPLKPQEAVKAILTLREDKSLRLAMGKNGKVYAERHLSIEKISKKMEEVFSSVLKK